MSGRWMIMSALLIAGMAQITLFDSVAESSAAAAEGGAAAKALKYRIVSFHETRMIDKNLIQLAADLGYNGVMIQMEGSNIKRIEELVEYDKKEGIFDFCHQLGMKVTVWVRELQDIPKETSPASLGPINMGNQKLWDFIAERYEWILKDAIPKVDGLVLTVVESQMNITDAAMMHKLTEVIDQKCSKYGKQFIVRTFVWHPEELEGVMGAVSRLPEDTVIMSKVVPQDWQMRGIDAMEIGRVGNREQIVEYDVAGEYFLRDSVANCFPDLLKRQFDYGIAKGIDGICVRVDRRGASVLHSPQEVNLWALGMFATGETMDVDDVWKAWAEARFENAAAPGVIKALKPTSAVVAEMLSVGPFTLGDTRRFPPPRPDEDFLNQNWQNWRWDASLIPQKIKIEEGDSVLIREIEEQKLKAANLARQSLEELAAVENKLDPADYQILRTKLLTNKVQLEFRSAMAMTILRANRLIRTKDSGEQSELLSAITKDLQTIQGVAQRDYGKPVEIEKSGRKWKVGVPEGLNVKKMNEWVEKTKNFISEKGFELPQTLLLSAGLVGGMAVSSAAEQRPNVLVILADDLGYGDLSCYGAEKVKTPNIDRLARQGVRFTDAHAAAAVCQPSRYSVMTGRYEWRRGKPWNGTYMFEDKYPTLQQVLGKAGYDTAAFGKWHNGWGLGPVDYNDQEVKPGPLESGFGYYFGTPRSHNEPPQIFIENRSMYKRDPSDPLRIIEHSEVVERGLKDWGWGLSEGAVAAHAARPEEEIDLIIAERAADYLRERRNDEPFFLYVAFVAPHVPISPAKRFQGSSRAGEYGDYLQQLDSSVGVVLDALKSAGLDENTLVIFSSDNGAVYMDSAIAAGHHQNGNLLGQKTDAWCGANQVPFIARWPGKVPAGKTSDAFVSLADIMATVTTALGIETPDTAIDSLNQMPVFLSPDGESIRKEMIYTGIFGKGLYADGWVFYPFQGSGGMTAHPTQRWGVPYSKMGVTNSDLNPDGSLKADAPPAQLYNVKNDPGETRNLHNQHPERVAMMKKRLAELIAPPAAPVGEGSTLSTN